MKRNQLCSCLRIIKRSHLYYQYEDFLRIILRTMPIDNNDITFLDILKSIERGAPPLHLFFQKSRNEFADFTFELLNHTEIKISIYGEANYPESYYNMEDPPMYFFYRGESCWLTYSSISVVGSREPLALTEEWIETELYSFIKQNKVCVVSGGARGVDQSAHRIALRLGFPTVAILPSGLLNLYPSSLSTWQESILSCGGCLLSEFDFYTGMKKYHFDYRNRLIAGFSPITVIVEARRKSGTLLTAHHAAKFGRTVLVVPGHPRLKNFAGSNDLLVDGASIVRDAQDLALYFNSEKGSN